MLNQIPYQALIKQLRRIAVLCTATTAISAGTADAEQQIVSIEYSHSLRIPNSKVNVTIDRFGLLILTTETRGKKPTTVKQRVGNKELARIKKGLAAADWSQASTDTVRGLDGYTVKIAYDGSTLSLWTPDYDSRKRGLETLQKVVWQIFKVAGLDEKGLPLKTHKSSGDTSEICAPGKPKNGRISTG